MTNDTPMIQQYKRIKAKHTDTILFFRLGDFYEMFFEDATLASRILGLTLTGRGKDDQRIPMCGIPHHAADGYVSRLIQSGHKVAICEQTQDASESKGLTNRDVVRIITPGTVQLASVLDDAQSNYLGAVYRHNQRYGLAYVDASTGAFYCDTHPTLVALQSDIQRVGMSELLLPDDIKGTITHNTISPYFPVTIDQAEDAICAHFKIQSLEAFGIQDNVDAFPAIAAILDYLNYTQKGAFSQIKKITPVRQQDHCLLHASVLEHLDVFHKEYGLFRQLNRTKTSMGARQLRQYLRYPLIDNVAIAARQDQVTDIIDHHRIQDWHRAVETMNDIERLMARVGSRLQNPRDLLGILSALNGLDGIESFAQSLGPAFSTPCNILLNVIHVKGGLHELRQLLDAALREDAPAHIRDGGIFKPGYSVQLDELCQSFSDVRSWVSDLEPRLRDELGVRSLKVGFNKVFGYYIEIPHSHRHVVPDTFIRKQTLANAERYITSELKEKETHLLHASQQQVELERSLYIALEVALDRFMSPLQTFAKQIAHIDAMVALADVAVRYGMTRPRIHHTNANQLTLQGLWHPMVATMQSTPFVRNDVSLSSESPFMLITGPNMAGKSTVMRSVALCIIMGQMGAYVPAQVAEFDLVDAIYTRIGATDRLAQGQSTFMVEMVETAEICQNATKQSLILLDEIGRGTSTFDGVSIAAAVTQYLVSHIQARTVFATHYHELTALSDQYPQIQNATMAIKEHNNTLVFSYQLLQGTAQKSYGVTVARMAGLPAEITDKADEWLKRFEQQDAMSARPILTLLNVTPT